jgi:hypothetical protein
MEIAGSQRSFFALLFASLAGSCPGAPPRGWGELTSEITHDDTLAMASSGVVFPTKMLLPREFVTYLSRQIVQRITGTAIETHAPERVVEIVDTLISDEMAAEDKLNDEVRDLLEEYSDYMRRESISYQDMFRKIKNTLIQKKKIVRASGRDTGDAMKLSRDKITDISHKLVALLRKSRDLRLKKDQNDARLDIVKAFTEILQVEEKADRAARDKVRSVKRDIPEGSEEFEILQKKYYAEELKKYGIEFTGQRY